MIATHFIEQGFPVRAVLENVGLTTSQYYYRTKETNKKQGRPPSTSTYTEEGQRVPNEVVVQQIEELLKCEFVDYGYVKVTYWLRKVKHYVISFKKVYRLMSEHKLLLARQAVNRSARTWVKELVPQPKVPFQNIELDIKYIYLHGQRRNAMMLTAIDVLSRFNMGFILQYSIKKEDVAALFDMINEQFSLPQGVTVRNDNGSQFTASLVREKLFQMGIEQEFSRPATPEQNAHIEAYHSIVERAVCNRYQFDDIKEAKNTLYRFWHFYNFDRLHSGIEYDWPSKYLEELGVQLDTKEFCPCGWTLETSANERDFEEGLMGQLCP